MFPKPQILNKTKRDKLPNNKFHKNVCLEKWNLVKLKRTEFLIVLEKDGDKNRCVCDRTVMWEKPITIFCTYYV